MKGVSDVIAIPPKGVTWFIEVKDPTKGKLSADQKKFRDMVEDKGCVYMVATCAGDVLDEIKKREAT